MYPAEYFTLRVPAIRNMIPAIHGNDTIAYRYNSHVTTTFGAKQWIRLINLFLTTINNKTLKSALVYHIYTQMYNANSYALEVSSMANEEHLNVLLQGIEVWNEWRLANLDIVPDLSEVDLTQLDLRWADLRRTDLIKAKFSEADLSEVNLSGANLSEAEFYETNLFGAKFYKANLSNANLSGANLIETVLFEANLSGADLSGANLEKADLGEANLSGANLSEAVLNEVFLFEADLSRADLSEAELINAVLVCADLNGANLNEANLVGANLVGANLSGANLSEADLGEANLGEADFSGAVLLEANLKNSILVETKLLGADLTGCSIYGTSVWNVEIDENTKQNNLVITKNNESTITVDNLEVAQFIYLLLNNQKIRDVINTITSKVVLILGRFTPERKVVLDAIREELRNYNYTPVMFDFDKPDDRNFIETVSTLAHMARFIVADFTDPKIVLQEAQYIIPNIAIPFAPIFSKGAGSEPVTLYDLRKGRTTVLDTFCYNDCKHLLENLNEMIIKPAEALARDLNMENPIK